MVSWMISIQVTTEDQNEEEGDQTKEEDIREQVQGEDQKTLTKNSGTIVIESIEDNQRRGGVKKRNQRYPEVKKNLRDQVCEEVSYRQSVYDAGGVLVPSRMRTSCYVEGSPIPDPLFVTWTCCTRALAMQ